MNDFNELIKQLGEAFNAFCKDPDHEEEGVIIGILGAFKFCYDDPEMLFEDDNCPAQIEVFMEALMESLIHYKGLLERGGFLK